MTKAISLKEKFHREIAPELKKQLKIKNINAVPRLSKITINAGIGKLLAGGKDFTDVETNIMQIAGQKPVIAKAKKAISNFKLREGMPVGVYVTIRGDRMYDFVSKFVNVVLPRTRDFRGISPKSFDGKGNYSIAIREHTVFPEINPDDIIKHHGLQITFVTTAKNNDDAHLMLKMLGFPFQEKKEKAEAK